MKMKILKRILKNIHKRKEKFESCLEQIVKNFNYTLPIYEFSGSLVFHELKVYILPYM